MKKLLALLVCLLCVVTGLLAQDKIYKKGGEVIEAKISEVGTDEIKYKLFNNQDGPVYTIEKARISKVVYQNGQTEIYKSNNLNDPELYAEQAKNAVKINFLSPLLGYTQLNYEHNLRPGRSYELSLGIIGLGKRQEIGTVSTAGGSTTRYRGQAGAFLGGGFKFSKMPDYINGKDRYSHIMQGLYAKPEILAGVYSQNLLRYSSSTGSNTDVTKKTTAFGSLLINIGKQWVLGDLMVIDLYAGVGYAIDNLHKKTSANGEFLYAEDYIANHFAIVATGTDSGLGFGGGIRVGILIK